MQNVMVSSEISPSVDMKGVLVCDSQLLAQIEKIPNKMGFKIGDVAEIAGIKQYVLRYWESEFDALRPKKSKNGQRIYTRKDVETVLLIQHLLYNHRFSIEGARAALRGFKQEVSQQRDWTQAQECFVRARNEIVDLANDIRRARRLFE